MWHSIITLQIISLVASYRWLTAGSQQAWTLFWKLITVQRLVLRIETLWVTVIHSGGRSAMKWWLLLCVCNYATGCSVSHRISGDHSGSQRAVTVYSINGRHRSVETEMFRTVCENYSHLLVTVGYCIHLSVLLFHELGQRADRQPMLLFTG